MENMQEDTPVSDESQTQPPVEETVQEEVEASEANETDEITEEAGDNAVIEGEDVQASAPETPEEDDEEDNTFAPVAAPQPVDINAFIDENGNFDGIAFNAAQQAQIAQAVQAAVQQSANERKYEKTWDKAYESFPELRKNKELRNMVQAIHANSPATGKYLSPKQAAEKFFGFAGAAKQQGIKAAQTTRTVQAAAGLGITGAAATPSGSKEAQLRDQMHNAPTLEGRQAANKALLEALISSGKV